MTSPSTRPFSHTFLVSVEEARLTPASDPFLAMIENNKTYGFTIAVKELRETVPNIFRYASAYKRLNNLTSQGLWEMFVEPPPDKEELDKKKSGAKNKNNGVPPSYDLPTELPEIDAEAMEGESYNMCHFWSNFEIARLDFFRSEAYENFFQMMDRSGGFWMERVRLFLVSCFIPPFPHLNPPYDRHTISSKCQPTFFLLTVSSNSGETPRSTRSPLARCSPRATSTTSATLATATRRSNTAPPTRPPASCRASPGSSSRRPTPASAARRTPTGTTLTRPRKTASGAAAAAIPTLSTSRARRAVVWLSGSMSLVGGPVLECDSAMISSFALVRFDLALIDRRPFGPSLLLLF